MVFVALLLAACDPAPPEANADTALSLPFDAAPAPIALHYLQLGATPLDQGEQVKLQARGATPGAQVTFYYSLSTGHGACPPAMQGWCLQLTGAVNTVAVATANGAGVATLQFTMPNVMLGQAVHIEAVQTSPIVKVSDVESRQVRPFGATSDYRVIDAVPKPDYGQSYPGHLVLHPMDILEYVHLRSVGVFGCGAFTPAPQASVGIYTDNGNDEPGQLLVQSPAFTVNQGPNEVAMPPVDLPPGRYWVAKTFSGVTATCSNAWLTGHEALVPLAWGTPMPATINGAAFYWSGRHATFVNVY